MLSLASNAPLEQSYHLEILLSLNPKTWPVIAGQENSFFDRVLSNQPIQASNNAFVLS